MIQIVAYYLVNFLRVNFQLPRSTEDAVKSEVLNMLNVYSVPSKGRIVTHHAGSSCARHAAYAANF